MFSPSYFTSSPLVLRRIRYRSADMRYRRNMAPLRDLKGPICSRFCCISPGGFITCCCCCYTRRFHRSNILRYYIFRVGAHVTNHCLQSRSTRLPTWSSRSICAPLSIDCGEEYSTGNKRDHVLFSDRNGSEKERTSVWWRLLSTVLISSRFFSLLSARREIARHKKIEAFNVESFFL